MTDTQPELVESMTAAGDKLVEVIENLRARFHAPWGHPHQHDPCPDTGCPACGWSVAEDAVRDWAEVASPREANFVPTGYDNGDECCLGCGENLYLSGNPQHTMLDCIQNLAYRVAEIENAETADCEGGRECSCG